jgi:small subunit ribosomal protein S1
VGDEDEDFGALFEASVKARRFDRGQTVEGVVVSVGAKVAFVDVGGKSEAQIDVGELQDAAGNLEVAIGDRIRAMVVSTAGGVVLSRKGVRHAETQRELEDAFRAGLAVEGRVEQVVKGGYEVRIARERAFCPLSQIDVVRTEDPAVHVGQVYAFRIVEYRDGGRNLVVSRRRHLEEEQRAKAAELRGSIVPGAVLAGRVVSVPPFGAFVDLGGGIQGLLHVSDMSWSQVTSPAAMVAVGDAITVKVLRVDEATQKIALGLKQLQDDPWTAAAGAYAVGQVRTGRITRIADFGAFVELEPGITALAHASTFAPTGRPGGWARSIAVGTTGEFEILSVDPDQKRIGVALVEAGSSGALGQAHGAIVPGAIVTGKVERHEKFGVFVYLGPGRTGLMPFSETGLESDRDAPGAFPIGSEIEVAILDVGPDGRRIRVSRKAVAAQREAEELREYTDARDAGPKPSLGSLADRLRGAFGKR